MIWAFAHQVYPHHGYQVSNAVLVYKHRKPTKNENSCCSHSALIIAGCAPRHPSYSWLAVPVTLESSECWHIVGTSMEAMWFAYYASTNKLVGRSVNQVPSSSSFLLQLLLLLFFCALWFEHFCLVWRSPKNRPGGRGGESATGGAQIGGSTGAPTSSHCLWQREVRGMMHACMLNVVLLSVW